MAMAQVGVQGEAEPGVVIKPVDDFNVGAISESPVGKISLPGFVGLVCFEANVRRIWGVWAVQG